MVDEKKNKSLVAIFWMFITGLLFVGVTGIVKHLGSELPAAQAAFLRYVLGLVFVIPLIGIIKRAHLTKVELSFLHGGA